MHCGDAQQLPLIRVKARIADRLDNGSLVGISAIGTALDQFPAVPFLPADRLLERILLDVRGPRYQRVHAGQDVLDVLVREEWRQLEIVAGQFQIGLGTGAALILGLAESAPLTAEEVAVPGKGQLGRGLQDLVRPSVELLLGEGKGADVLASGLIDRHGNRIDVVDVIEQLQSTEAVALHLRVVLRRDQDAKQILPSDLRLLWSAKPVTDVPQLRNHYELYALKVTTTNGRAPLEGDVVTDAKDQFNNLTGQPEVSMTMNSEGARRWAALTKANVGKAVAIVLDGVVYSAPRVNQEIDGGESSISGNFTVEETKDLANTLKSGRMPAPAKIVQEEVVGPTLGAQSIQQGVISFIIAFVLLMIYMVAMYGFIPGMVANGALLINLFFTLGILTSFQAEFTSVALE